MEQTSITDNNRYPMYCYIASKNDAEFANFKRHPVYNSVLEHVSPQEGSDYLRKILEDNELHLSVQDWKYILRNDSIGNPRTIQYSFGDSQIVCSPTTLRYVKVLSDISKLFPENIIQGGVSEIGIGYGGQCRILMHALPLAFYNLVDLPEVLSLAERFLTELDVAGDIRYIDGTHLYHDAPCDLLISNYAFSELVKPVQDIYIKKILRRAKAGYITWNQSALNAFGWSGGYTLEEFLPMIPGATTIPEEPLTAEGNCIVVWGTK